MNTDEHRLESCVERGLQPVLSDEIRADVNPHAPGSCGQRSGLTSLWEKVAAEVTRRNSRREFSNESASSRRRLPREAGFFAQALKFALLSEIRIHPCPFVVLAFTL